MTYRDFEGSGPDYVRVSVGGDNYDLAPADPADKDWKHGVSYSRTMHLPVGDWPITFEARGRDKFTSSFNGPTVSITPKPDPTPDPTPKRPPSRPRSPTLLRIQRPGPIPRRTRRQATA